MNILIVGNVLKDVYLNLDTLENNFEIDKNGVSWLDVNFGALHSVRRRRRIISRPERI